MDDVSITGSLSSCFAKVVLGSLQDQNDRLGFFGTDFDRKFLTCRRFMFQNILGLYFVLKISGHATHSGTALGSYGHVITEFLRPTVYDQRLSTQRSVDRNRKIPTNRCRDFQLQSCETQKVARTWNKRNQIDASLNKMLHSDNLE